MAEISGASYTAHFSTLQAAQERHPMSFRRAGAELPYNLPQCHLDGKKLQSFPGMLPYQGVTDRFFSPDASASLWKNGKLHIDMALRKGKRAELISILRMETAVLNSFAQQFHMSAVFLTKNSYDTTKKHTHETIWHWFKRSITCHHTKLLCWERV